jgi:uncharacterized Ntn-hydrolase superfamily protein
VIALLATFSIVAADPATGEVGVAVASKYPAVGALVPAAKAGVGAVATQGLAQPAWKEDGLKLLAQGVAPAEAVKRLAASDPAADDRQVGLVNARGDSAAFTGARCIEHAGQISGPGFSVQANLAADRGVLEAMARAYQRSAGKPLAERLLAALAAGEAAGGDRRGRQSAALLVAGGRPVDLRVDDAAQPIAELKRLYYQVHQYYFGESAATLQLTDALSREIQKDLKALGYLRQVDPAWSPAAQKALQDWIAWENLGARAKPGPAIDELVLKRLREAAAASSTGKVPRP